MNDINRPAELAEPIVIQFTVTLKASYWDTIDTYNMLIEGGYDHAGALAYMANDWQKEYWSDFYDEQVEAKFLHLGRPHEVAPQDMPTVAGPAHSNTDSCLECDGEGVLDPYAATFIKVQGSDILVPIPGSKTVPCLRCGGTGRVPKKD